MNKLNKMLPYLLICILAYYITPLIGKDMGVFMFMLLIAVPVVCFAVSLRYSLKNKFTSIQLLFSILVGALFIPSIYIFYNSTAWFYPIFYALISLFGNVIGYGMTILKNRSK